MVISYPSRHKSGPNDLKSQIIDADKLFNIFIGYVLMFKKTRKNVSFFFSTLSLLAISCVEVYADQPHQSPKESKISALLNSEISVRLTEDGEKMSSADECVAAVFEVEDQMGVEFSYEFFDALVQICESNL